MKTSLRVVALLIVASLASCRQGPPVPSDARALTLDEVKPLYQPMTDVALPAQTSFPLGETYTYGGKVVNWQATASVPLLWNNVLTMPATISPGQLLPDGTLQTTAQPQVLWTRKLSQMLSADGTYCPIKTLTLSSDPQVEVAYAANTFSLSVSDRSKGIQPLRSFPTTWTDLDLDLREWKDADAEAKQTVGVLLVKVPEAVTVKGENRCISGTMQTQPSAWKSVEQRQSVANFRLEKGWNALLNKRTSLSYDNSVSTMKHEWQVLPASALTKWMVR